MLSLVKLNAILFFSFVFILSAEAEPQRYTKYFKDFKKPSGQIPGLDHSDIRLNDRIDLGKTLFFDPRLSDSGWISCATCHNPALGWEDGLSLGFGHGMKKLGRHTPTILNLAYNESEAFFWDGRADSLESQALGPIQAAGEMNMSLDKMLSKLNSIKSYKSLFTKSFKDGSISKENVAKAIADFERTIVSKEAPFDKWIEGDDSAISSAAKNGFLLFNEKANCAVCHSGWRFTDDGFHNIGVGSKDQGRYTVLKIDVLKQAFKTPTLRNIENRAPYLHDGSAANLVDVLKLYNKGGRIKTASLSSEVRSLNLNSQEIKDLEAFLLTLTSEDEQIKIPILPQ